MKGGWFIGDFEPTAYKTKDFEVSYKTHVKDEKWDHHYHTIVTEINLIISGEMILQGKTLKENDIFILEPYEIADPQFFLTRGFLQISIVSKISKHHFFYRIV